MPHKNNLRLAFKNAQSTFDKKVRYYKRKHEKEKCEALEANARRNPTEMWAALRRLSNPPKGKAALEII